MIVFSLADFAAFLDVPEDSINETRLNVLTAKAEALIRGYARSLPEDYVEWPEGAKAVALDVVARAWQQADMAGVDSLATTAGPFSQTRQFSSSAGSVWLSKQDKAILSGGAAGGRGAYAIDMTPDAAWHGRMWRAPDEWGQGGVYS